MNSPVDAVRNVASRLIDTLIAGNRGDQQAFSYNGKRYSYQDVAALMNRAGNLALTLGVRPGERVLLLLPASPAFVASVLGVIKAGAVPVIDVPRDPAEFERCIAAAKPSAAIVHENRLPAAEKMLDTLLKDRTVVVGADVHGHRSFVDELRSQSSWLPPHDVEVDAPALAAWTPAGLDSMSHAELGLRVDRGRDAGAGEASNAGSEKVSLLATLRAFSAGEEAALG